MDKKIPVIVTIIGIIVSVIGISVGLPTINDKSNNTVTQNPEININIVTGSSEKSITQVEMESNENSTSQNNMEEETIDSDMEGKPPIRSDPEEKRIATEILEMLHDKIKKDVLIIDGYLASDEIQTPFDPKVFDDNKFFTCNEGFSNDKCPILFKIWEETESAYAFLFYYPGEQIANTNKKTSSDCIIEISTLNSVVTRDITNQWNDRQWCNSDESILMTDLYHPRNKPMINVNSLLMEYRDFNNDRLGIVNAYNLEESIKNNMEDDYLSTFNVILLDDKNCVAAAVSKTDDFTAVHMEKGIWQLSNEKTNSTFRIFEDTHNETNCNQDYLEYNLDALKTIDITIDGISEGEISKLSKRYTIFEMKPVTDKDLGRVNVDIFQDWHLLVSAQSKK